MAPVSLIVVGAGQRGTGYARWALRNPGRAAVVAVAEPNETRRARLAAEHGIAAENATAGWRELAGRAKFADAVLICTPDRMHVEPAEAFAALGYHILLEKPMAPDEAGCRRIVAAVEDAGVMLAVGHVMRYTPYTRAVKEIADSGELGEIMSVQHLEPVGFWHHAHSYVRGNWRRAALSASMLMAKSCHDLDWLQYVLGRAPLRVSSFGSLTHFTAAHRPENAADRCVACAAEAGCAHSATRFYGDLLARGEQGWPLSVVIDDFTPAALDAALRTGPYGRCVYGCDNDVVDHQVVALEFPGATTATFTMTAFTEAARRSTRLFGTRAELTGDGHTVRVYDFLARAERLITPEPDSAVEGGHGGGDAGLMDAFTAAVAAGRPDLIKSGPRESLASHLAVFAAERARQNGTVETVRPSPLTGPEARTLALAVAGRGASRSNGAMTPDKEAIRRKYAAERDKRLRPDGSSQYLRVAGHLARYLDDPYMPVAERPAVTDDVTFAFIGGGFAGLLAGARLREAGIADVRIIDKAGDFGGTWYWNRYPGAMCDTASMVYMPLLEETGHMPTEKYAHGPEILEHCRRIGKHFGLYDNALFHTEVTSLAWDESRSRWRLCTSRGDDFTARFVGIGPGPLHVPKLPGIEGIELFGGCSFHTSRWDYAFTGGDPAGAPMDRLADKRVAVIGTGATAVQCVPELAKASKELYVFQRTPSSIDVRGNGPIDPDWFATVATAGWQQRWLDNFTANWEGILGAHLNEDLEDLVQDGWTDLARRIRDAIGAVPAGERTRDLVLDIYEDADNVKMEEIRARVDAVVADPDTAANLKAWYRQLCKRPCFHDEYLQAFNQPNAHLVDTDGKGVQRITATGVVAGGREYPVDCIIYASGFEFGIGHDIARRAGFDPAGRDGLLLSRRWATGIRTLHGMHVRGFPNLFMVQLPQGAALASNVPHNYVESTRAMATVVRHAVDGQFAAVEVTKEAEDAWVELLLAHGRPVGRADCTPGYYNNEGQPQPESKLNVGYPQGAGSFFTMLDEWRQAGTFSGLSFRR